MGGGGGNENKDKFEKLKKFVPNCKRKNLLGVFAMMTWPQLCQY